MCILASVAKQYDRGVSCGKTSCAWNLYIKIRVVDSCHRGDSNYGICERHVCIVPLQVFPCDVKNTAEICNYQAL